MWVRTADERKWKKVEEAYSTFKALDAWLKSLGVVVEVSPGKRVVTGCKEGAFCTWWPFPVEYVKTLPRRKEKRDGGVE